jgi:ribosomal protein S18 acetylase RimI-like enzyme
MKLVHWKRYLWDLKKLPDYEPQMSSSYVIRPAERDEEKAVQNVVSTAFSLDMAWGDSFKAVRGFIETQLAQTFLSSSTPAVVITHGTRIIAASVINNEENAVTHLISGPCVLSEYRSRGLGTTLLHESLKQLKKCNLSLATGVSKDGVPVSKFIYSKFGSTTEEFEPALLFGQPKTVSDS